MTNAILCVVCTESLEISKKLFDSFDRQRECVNYTLHVASYRGLDRYPAKKQLDIYFAGPDNAPYGDEAFLSEKPEYVIFINEHAELYGEDFLLRVIEPLKKDPGIFFSIPATLIRHEKVSSYQLNLSFGEKKYGIALCNTITGFAPEKYAIFAQHNALAIAMRYNTYLEIQKGCDFIANPADFHIIPELMRRYPKGAVVAPRCAAYMPSFSNFVELWKIFYMNGKRNSWFNRQSREFKININSPFQSFYTLAYYCGAVREYFRGLKKSDAFKKAS